MINFISAADTFVLHRNYETNFKYRPKASSRVAIIKMKFNTNPFDHRFDLLFLNIYVCMYALMCIKR